MSSYDRVSDNLARVRSAMAQACERADRSVDSVRLVAVTKYAQLDWVRDLISAGQTVLGESRPQQLAARAEELAAEFGDRVEWHMIGHLQRNKVELVLPVAALTHSVDSLRLAKRISTVAETRGDAASVLIEVNVSGEQSKDGFAPDDLRASWEELCQLPGLEIRGLMTMAPLSENPEDSRKYFDRCRELYEDLRSQGVGEGHFNLLSMGMSNDYEVAIEEGANLVRVGRSIFGESEVLQVAESNR